MIQQFFEKAAKKNQSYTFSDITFKDLPSSIIPSQVKLDTQITRNYTLKTPIISAAMDTVTEATMALAMAKIGGLGVIHRNLSVADQVAQVEWVRRQVHYGGIVSDPVCFQTTDTLADLQQTIKKQQLTFTSFPIVAGQLLRGMITRDELDFVRDSNPLLETIMKPIDQLVTANAGISTEDAYRIMQNKRIKKLPLVTKTGQLAGMYVWADVKKSQYSRSNFSLDHSGRLLVAAAVGPSPQERPRIEALLIAGCPILVIDCSHGACDAVRQQVNYIRSLDQPVDIIAGNIASAQAARYLLEHQESQPDALKIGIGPGSICTTRSVTGHGVPQMTAIYDVVKIVTEFKTRIPVIADGGITSSGDMVKSFAVGADAIMLGSLLAGTDEAPGEIVTQGQKKYKRYRGMGSRAAMSERAGSRMRYFKDSGEKDVLTLEQESKLTPEGVEGLVEYKGSVVGIIDELRGGIGSGFAHSGAGCITELRNCVELWVQTNAGYLEGMPHHIMN
jgi:IMP dehydrogenase